MEADQEFDTCSLQGRFLKRALAEFKNGTVISVILHVKSAMGYSWLMGSGLFQHPYCLLSDRLSFNQPGREDCEQKSPHGSIILYLGSEEGNSRFVEKFAPYGIIPGYNAWSY